MIKSIEVKDVGVFEVKADMTHRTRCYLKLETNIRQYEQVQFDCLDKTLIGYYQNRYDINGNEIKIKYYEN